jgi:hypothetical protein
MAEGAFVVVTAVVVDIFQFVLIASAKAGHWGRQREFVLQEAGPS